MGLYDRDLHAVLGEIAGPTAAPGAGAVSGIVTAMAAGLIASAARRSPAWEEGRGVSAQAQALRSRVEKLAEANEEAYLEALALIEGAEEEGTRDAAIGKALDTALSIAECAYDVALLGCEAAQHAAPGGAEDACAASLLAEAAARAAAGLVAANLVSMPGDERVVHAQRLAEAATVAAKRAVAASASR
jgi:formiminotetrahydrofolate cyclodeaminase